MSLSVRQILLTAINIVGKMSNTVTVDNTFKMFTVFCVCQWKSNNNITVHVYTRYIIYSKYTYTFRYIDTYGNNNNNNCTENDCNNNAIRFIISLIIITIMCLITFGTDLFESH